MNLPNFSPAIDFSLAGAIYTVSVFVTVIWLRRSLHRSGHRIKVTEGQIAARVLMVVLLLVIPCYLIDIAFWCVVCLIMAMLAFGFCLGGEPGGAIAGPIVLSALFVREFVLGFPDLILEPEAVRELSNEDTAIDALVGQQAVTASPLRPTGSIVQDGRVFQAVSEGGDFIDADVAVSIVGFRNGMYSVERIAKESNDL